MSGIPTIYCLTCHVLRVIKDWHEYGEALVIELEPCGHVVRRGARLEWLTREA